MKIIIECTGKEIADFILSLQSQLFRNRVCSLGDFGITVTETDLQGKESTQKNGFAG